MKATLSILVLMMASTSFAAAKNNNFSGKCAKAAVNAAVNFWADVPNPSESLEYIPVSAEPSKIPRIYDVTLAFSDGNDVVYGSYKVSFDNLGTCKGTAVRAVH